MESKQKINKLPKFIVGSTIDSQRIFITHCHEPFFIAEVFHLDIEEEDLQMKVKQKFKAGSSLIFRDEYIVIGVHEIIASKPFSQDSLPKLMSTTGDWYFSYLEKNYSK